MSILASRSPAFVKNYLTSTINTLEKEVKKSDQSYWFCNVFSGISVKKDKIKFLKKIEMNQIGRIKSDADLTTLFKLTEQEIKTLRQGWFSKRTANMLDKIYELNNKVPSNPDLEIDTSDQTSFPSTSRLVSSVSNVSVDSSASNVVLGEEEHYDSSASTVILDDDNFHDVDADFPVNTLNRNFSHFENFAVTAYNAAAHAEEEATKSGRIADAYARGIFSAFLDGELPIALISLNNRIIDPDVDYESDLNFAKALRKAADTFRAALMNAHEGHDIDMGRACAAYYTAVESARSAKTPPTYLIANVSE